MESREAPLDIWLVKVGESSPLSGVAQKLRTARLASGLAKRGHRVTYWTSAFEHFKKEWIVDSDQTVAPDLSKGRAYSVRFIKGCGYRRNISLARFIDYRIISRKLKVQAEEEIQAGRKPDLIVAAMPPHNLAHDLVALAGAHRIPVLVDIRDPWPDLFIQYLPKFLRPFSRLLLFREFSMIRRTMAEASGIVAVSETFLEWGLNYAKRAKKACDRVFYLGGAAPAGQTPATPKITAALAGAHSGGQRRMIVSFYGLFGHINDVFTIVEAARLLQNESVYFILAGDGEFLNEAKKRATGLSSVVFTGWVDDAEIQDLASRSDLGVSATAKRLDLFQNKVFAYFSRGVPVAASFYGDLKKLQDERKVGFFFPPQDAQALARGILQLQKDQLLHQSMKNAAKSAFAELFDADQIDRDYMDHIEQMARGTGDLPQTERRQVSVI